MKKLFAILLCAVVLLCPLTAQAETYSGITLHVVDINADNEQYDAMIDAFIATHPGIAVETNHAVNDAPAVMSALIASNSTPDIFVSSIDMISLYKEYLYDWSKDEEALAMFQPEYLPAVTDASGAIYGIPNGCINIGIVYNKEILKEAGYDTFPKTHSEFEKMCADIYEKTGIVPFIISGAEGWMMAHMSDAYIITKDQPGSIAAEKFGKGEIKVTEASGNFDNYFRMFDIAKKYTDGETLIEYDWEYSCNLIASGKIASFTYGDWAYVDIAMFNPDAPVAIASYPVSENPDDVITPNSVNQVAMVFKNNEHADLARELAMFITGTLESAVYMATGYGSVSCNIHADEVDKSLFTPLLVNSLELAAEGRCVDRMQNYYPLDTGVNFIDEIGEAMQGYLIDLYTQEEAEEIINNAWPVSK